MTQSIESMIEVLQAYKDGKKIEYRIVGSTKWSAIDNPQWHFVGCEYRIAQEPKKKVKLEAWLTPTEMIWVYNHTTKRREYWMTIKLWFCKYVLRGWK